MRSHGHPTRPACLAERTGRRHPASLSSPGALARATGNFWSKLQVALKGVVRDPEFTTGTDDAKGDFTAIGDEDFLNHQKLGKMCGCKSKTGRFAAVERGKTSAVSTPSDLLELEQPLAVFHGLPVFHQHLHNGALRFSLDLIHDLHRLDNTDDGVLHDFRPDISE